MFTFTIFVLYKDILGNSAVDTKRGTRYDSKLKAKSLCEETGKCDAEVDDQ